MMKYFYIIIVLVSITDLFCQQPGFIKVYNEHRRNQARYEDVLIDNDTIVLYAVAYDTTKNNWGIKFFKYDIDGNELSSTSIIDTTAILTSTYFVKTIIKTSDGGYAMFGSALVEKSKPDFNYMIKVNHNLELEFIEKYFTESIARSMVETDDGYLLLSNIYVPNDEYGEYDPYLIKTNKNGKEIWRKQYENKKIDEIGLLIKKQGINTFIITGEASTPVDDESWPQNDTLWMKYIIIDSLGNKLHSSENHEVGTLRDFKILKDSSWICIGSTWEYNPINQRYDGQPLIYRLSKNNNVLWKQTPGVLGSFFDDFFDLEAMPDGNFLASGTTISYAYLHKFDIDGNEIWHRVDEAVPGQRVRGGGAYTASSDLLSNGDIISCGWSADTSGNFGFLMKITSDGCIDISECPDWTAIEDIAKKRLDINISPNPASNFVVFTKVSEVLQKAVDIQIFDVMARHVQDVKISAFEQDVEMDVSKLINGVYFCRVVLDGEIIGVRKLVVSK